MIEFLKGDVYKSDVNIIFNPVGVHCSNGFIPRVKILYPEAYKEYEEDVWLYNIRRLRGEIQLIQIGERKVMMNGFCKDKKGKVVPLWLGKALVELCNLAYEYELSVGIEYGLGVKDEEERKYLEAIIEEVFHDVDISTRIYTRT